MITQSLVSWQVQLTIVHLLLSAIALADNNSNYNATTTTAAAVKAEVNFEAAAGNQLT